MKILEGIRVLEWAIAHAGPEAGRLLAELGAEVIKIEGKDKGDPLRGTTVAGTNSVTSPTGRNLYFEGFNCNKRSVALDLKSEGGRQILHALVAKSDVFLVSFRAPAIKRLNMDYETLSQCNPKLIYCRVSGYGPRGPDADTRSTDLAGQARSGIMWQQRSQDEVPFSPTGLADQMAGISAAYGILAALLARERWGIGQEIDVSLLGGMMWLQTSNLTMKLLADQEFRSYGASRSGNPLLNVYRAADGKWLCLSMGAEADRYWPSLCRALGMPDLEEDPRFDNLRSRAENKDVLVPILDQVFGRSPRDEWLRILKEWDLMASPVNTVSELLQDPQVVENDYVVDYNHPVLGGVKMRGYPVHFSRTPASVCSPAPEHGEHTEQVLQELLGCSWEKLGQLREERVI